MNENYKNIFYRHYVSTHTRVGCAPDFGRRKPYLKNIVKSYFPSCKDSKILEIGCGDGSLMRMAQELGYENIFGVDASKEQVDIALKSGINNIQHIEFAAYIGAQPSSSLDMVIAIDVFEHMTKLELMNTLKEIFRVLVPGGSLLIHVPNAASPFFGRVYFGDFTHEQAFTQASINQLLRIVGFNTVVCHEESPVIHGVLSLVRWIFWKILRVIFLIMLVVETGISNEIFSANIFVEASKNDK